MGPDASRDNGSDADEVDGETEHERLNRELDQLLQELRVALPGVQVLFAFLLTVPFSSRYQQLGDTARDVYFAAVLLAALTSVFLIAPTVHHRLRFREGTKAELVRMSNRFALIGATCLGLAMGCTVFVVGSAAFPGTPAQWMGPALVAVAAVVWFVIPFRYRSHRERSSGAAAEEAGSR